MGPQIMLLDYPPIRKDEPHLIYFGQDIITMNLTKDAHILICDDDEHVLFQIKQYLNELGYHNITSTSCYEEAYLSLNHSSIFQLAIIDLRMPENGGTNLMQFIKASDDHNIQNIQVMAISGSINRSEKNFLADLDISRVINKPISKKELVSVLAATFPEENAHPSEVESYEQLVKIVSLSIRLGRDLDISEHHIQKNILKDPESLRLSILLAEVMFAKKNVEAAESIVLKVISINKHFLPAMNLFAKILVFKGSFNMALDYLESAQLLSPLNTQRLLAIGELHLGHNRYNAAEEKFKKALAINPNLESAKIGLARSYLERGHSEGENIIKEITDPNIIAGELNLKGVLLAKGGLFKEAITIYYKALSCALSDKHEMLITYNIALAYYKNGENVRANTMIEKALMISPYFPKSIRLKNRLFAKKPYGDKEKTENSHSHFFTRDQISFLLGQKNNVSSSALETDDAKLSIKEKPSKLKYEIKDELERVYLKKAEKNITDYKADHERNREISRKLNKKLI